jgi:hypothetical protein
MAEEKGMYSTLITEPLPVVRKNLEDDNDNKIPV